MYKFRDVANYRLFSDKCMVNYSATAEHCGFALVYFLTGGRTVIECCQRQLIEEQTLRLKYFVRHFKPEHVRKYDRNRSHLKFL